MNKELEAIRGKLADPDGADWFDDEVRLLLAEIDRLRYERDELAWRVRDLLGDPSRLTRLKAQL